MKKEKIIDFRTRKLVFIDLETTGLDFLKHEIIEMACLVVDGRTFKVLLEFEAKVKPEHLETADSEALEIAGYSQEKWRTALPLREVLTRVNQLTSGGMLAGWNVYFDWWFLEAGLRKLGMNQKFDYHKVDVMSIAYAKLYAKKEIKDVRLRKIAPHFGVRVPEQHGAMVDIKATYEIFKRLMKEK